MVQNLESRLDKFKGYIGKGLGVLLLTGLALTSYGLISSPTTYKPEIKQKVQLKSEQKNNSKNLIHDDLKLEWFYAFLFANICLGTLASACIYLQNKKNKPQKGSLKPQNLTELVSLPLDTALKYSWPASIAAGIATVNTFYPELPNVLQNFHNSEVYFQYTAASLSALYSITSLTKLTLDRFSPFKKPFLKSFPKTLIYLGLQLKSEFQGDYVKSRKFNTILLDNLEEIPEKQLAKEIMNLELDADKACYNLVSLDQIIPRGDIDPFFNLGDKMMIKILESTSQRKIQKNPEKALYILMNLQQKYLQSQKYDKVIKISEKILSEIKNQKQKLPYLIHQAKVLAHCNTDPAQIWKQTILTLLKEYNIQDDFKIRLGTQSEVLEIKPESTISGSNAIIIERSDNWNELFRTYKIEQYLSNVTQGLTPNPLGLFDIAKLSNSTNNYGRKYFLFMERKKGRPINVRDISLTKYNLSQILNLLFFYQQKATQNLGDIEVSLETLNYKNYFETKFLNRLSIDDKLKIKLLDGIKPIIDYLEDKTFYFNHFDLHDQNILFDNEITFIDSKDAILASFAIDLGFLGNYLNFGDSVIKPYYEIFGKKEGFDKNEFMKEAYSAMTLATAHLVGRNKFYNEGREEEFLINLKELADKLPEFYPEYSSKLQNFRNYLNQITL